MRKLASTEDLSAFRRLKNCLVGLGFEVLFALQQVDAGKGLLSGLAIVVCAMVNLSKIAREITGTRWSGPLFFGLKKRPDVRANHGE